MFAENTLRQCTLIVQALLQSPTSLVTLKRNAIQFTPFSLKEEDSPKNFCPLPSRFSNNFTGFTIENKISASQKNSDGGE